MSEEFFRNLISNIYKHCIGYLVLYDITNRKSFENVHKWIDNIQNKKHKITKIILIGNKCDLKNKRKVSFEDGKNLANKCNIVFYETSGKTGKNIKEVITFLTMEIFVELSLSSIRE